MSELKVAQHSTNQMDSDISTVLKKNKEAEKRNAQKEINLRKEEDADSDAEKP